MEALSGLRCFTTTSNFPFRRSSPVPRHQRVLFLIAQSVSSQKTSFNPVSELVEEEVLKTFLKERRMSGDIISKASDIIWQRDSLKLIGDDDDDDDDAGEVPVDHQQQNQVMQYDDDYDDGEGFLKLSQTLDWVTGEDSAPVNKKDRDKAIQDDREKRKKLNFLQYEALKRELLMLSVGIGIACSGYCLVVFSLQAAVSYAVGVLCSCLYLQLLCKYADNLSRDMVPQIFKQRKIKKIGIRSEDLSDSFEKTIKGSGMALSSPRLVIPAALYGLWALSHEYLSPELFDFQIVPAMFGLFVYKAAALVQVYRDNEDLQLIFPENEFY